MNRQEFFDRAVLAAIPGSDLGTSLAVAASAFKVAQHATELRDARLKLEQVDPEADSDNDSVTEVALSLRVQRRKGDAS